MPSSGSGQAAESPAFPPSMHRIGAVAHKSSTCLCTDSTEAGLRRMAGSSGSARGASPRRPGLHAACEVRDTLVRSPAPCRPGQASAAAGSRRLQVGARSTARLHPHRHRHDQDISQPNHYPPQITAGFYAIYRLLRAFLCRLARNLDICAMRVNSQSRALKFNLARLVWQAGKRCYRRSPRRR
jgi:hypothetical protein